MDKLVWGADSYANFNGESMSLKLSSSVWRAEIWQRVVAWFEQHHQQRLLLQAPFWVMTAEAVTEAGPRWKQMGLDVLSSLVFMLLIPPDHRLVQVWQAIDWVAINRLCAPCYQNHQHGQRAWAPAQLVALLLLLFVAPVMSERQLVQMVSLVPLYRWFCGFSLFSALPDHSTLYTFRQRLGVERFEAILTWVVLRCQEAGLIGQELLHYDMMLVKASTRAWTPYQRAVILSHALLLYLERRQLNLDQSLAEVINQVVAEVAVETVGTDEMKQDPKTVGRVLKSRQKWLKRLDQAKAPAHWQQGVEQAVQAYLAELTLEPEPEKAAGLTPKTWLKKLAQGLRRLLPDGRSDLDARLGRSQGLNFVCGYLVGFLVDQLHNLITVVQVVPANTTQQSQMMPALDQHRQRLGGNPKAVAADSAQDYYPVHQYLDAQHIEGHIAPRQRGTNEGLSSHLFVWDEQGQLHCPAGQVMTAGTPWRDGKVPFVASGCATCAQKAACLPKGQQPDGPRTLHLEPAAHQRLQLNREHAQTDAYRTAKSARFAREGLFGLARRLHHGQVMPYRSQPMNHVAGLLMGTVMNLLVLSRCRPAVQQTEQR